MSLWPDTAAKMLNEQYDIYEKAREEYRNKIAKQAARIEQLEAALRRWEQYGCSDCGGDCASANPPVSCCIMQETRAALGGHDE